MQHTSMTWHTARNSGNGQGLIIAENGDNVAVCYDEKDAPLIAAAPELLEALEALVGADNCNYMAETMRYAGYFDDARAAIAKAREEG